MFKQLNVQILEIVALLEQSKVHKSNLRTSSDGEALLPRRRFCLWHHSILGSEKGDIKLELNYKTNKLCMSRLK